MNSTQANPRRFSAEVFVFPRQEILDPQGKAIGNALSQFGFSETEDVRAGKSFQIELSGETLKQAQQRVQEMCEKLLANTITEDYSFEVKELQG